MPGSIRATSPAAARAPSAHAPRRTLVTPASLAPGGGRGLGEDRLDSSAEPANEQLDDLEGGGVRRVAGEGVAALGAEDARAAAHGEVLLAAAHVGQTRSGEGRAMREPGQRRAM